jgi:hypothetical protein
MITDGKRRKDKKNFHPIPFCLAAQKFKRPSKKKKSGGRGLGKKNFFPKFHF